MAAVAITRLELNAAKLRAAAKRAKDSRQARRILSIAMVLDGHSRAAAASAGGMDRQSLRDWIHRYNAHGLDGLLDFLRSGRPAKLSKAQVREVENWVDVGADLEQDGVVRFRRVDIRDRIAKHFGVVLHERTAGKLLRKLGFRRLSTRPVHPKADLAAQEDFKKTLPVLRGKRLRAMRPADPSRSGSRTKREWASKAH